MKRDPSNKHLALAHVWLFQVNVDTSGTDTEGTPIVKSLANVFDSVERDARKSDVVPKCSGIRPALRLITDDDFEETTGRYERGELEGLLRVAGKK